MKTILFTDLDDTLFSTERKQVINEQFILASTLKDGSNSGWQSPKQQMFMQLWHDALIIPVTARNVDSFMRVKIPFNNLAIINHGGIILDTTGKPDTKWHNEKLIHSEQSSRWLDTQCKKLATLAERMNIPHVIKINSDLGLKLYVSLKSTKTDDSAIERLAIQYEKEYIDEDQGYVHFNSNNLAILPNWLNKKFAVEYLITRLSNEHGELLTIGCGDSKSDMPFMQSCDFWITPQQSQINRNIEIK